MVRTAVENSPQAELVRAVAGGSLSVRALVATGLVADAARRHGTAPTASAALGRTLMAAVLIASGAKDEETVQIQLRGDGSLGPVTAIADSRGRVRGFAHDPSADPPARGGKLDVAAAVGRGVVAVVRYHPAWREPYTGIVPIVSGEIGEDLAHYLVESEQTASALAVGVFVASSGVVTAAGGYLVQALPGADELALVKLEHNVRALESPSSLVRAGVSAEELLHRLTAGLELGAIERAAPHFYCACDLARIRDAVTLLGRSETREIAERGESLVVRCEFCATRYELSSDEVGSLVPDA